MANGYRIIRRPEIPPEARGSIERSNALEKWGKMRETTDRHFKFTRRTTLYCVIWAGIVPFALYQTIKWERQRKDIVKGRPVKKYW
jgi:hypothetical protein